MTFFLILWLIGQVIAVLLIWHFALTVGRRLAATATPPVAIVVAVKGHDIEFDGFLEGVFKQDYPEYRILFGVETPDDEAVPAIEKWRAAEPDKVTLVIASRADAESQKITNVRATLPYLTAQDEILVFADADFWPQSDWLRRVVEPIVTGKADVVSAFPWLVPHDSRFSTLLLTAISAGVATAPRAPMWDSAWGGVMAVAHRRFDELNVAEAWRGAMSEDLQLTNAARGAGGKVFAPRELLMRTPIETHGLAHITEQARRWYMLVRIHAPVTYGLAVVVTTFNALGWLAVFYVALAKSFWAPLLVAFILSVLKSIGRAVLVRRLWGQDALAENRWLLLDWLIAPLATIVSAIFAWSSLTKWRTAWAGAIYEVRSPKDVRIIRKTPEAI